ncbi:MAG: HAMP domain-containing protein [Acidobacteria bacterium]|nr:HAMP domain-containing protein [Acidobacteriota bacterium]
MSIKAKQVAGVTTLVIAVVAVLSGYYLSSLSYVLLEETASRAELLSKATYQRAFQVVGDGPREPYAALRGDGGIRSILDSSIGYSKGVTYAAIVNAEGIAVASAPASREGTHLDEQKDFAEIVTAGPIARLLAINSDETFEYTQPLLVGTEQLEQFGSIRIGVSTLLVRSELRSAMHRAITVVIFALVLSSLVAIMLAQWMLRPIHVIQSGLSRLGRGDLDVRLDLPEQEFQDLGSSFQAVSAQLAALGKGGGDGSTLSSREGADYQSVMESLEDAVALFSPQGEVIFTNAAMRAIGIAELPGTHPVRQLVDRTLSTGKSTGPLSVAVPRGLPAEAGIEGGNGPAPEMGAESDADSERLLMCHAIEDTNRKFLGAMLVARNVGYLNQVQSTLNYSRKAAALGRLLAGVAHEVKNPLNAMTIHLELLKQKLGVLREPMVMAGPGGGAGKTLDLTKHVTIISSEIKRLDEVVAGFLKFARPEELNLQPILLNQVIHDVVMTIGPEAHRRRVAVREESLKMLPPINGDQGMLVQAVLNLAINALQAMPEGGTLRLGCKPATRHRVELFVEDTGIGIEPENLPRIFDLYFTTKEKGSGIGLSMVFRIVQLHDGEVEVQSTPGRGTRFRVMFPQA